MVILDHFLLAKMTLPSRCLLFSLPTRLFCVGCKRRLLCPRYFCVPLKFACENYDIPFSNRRLILLWKKKPVQASYFLHGKSTLQTQTNVTRKFEQNMRFRGMFGPWTSWGRTDCGFITLGVSDSWGCLCRGGRQVEIRGTRLEKRRQTECVFCWGGGSHWDSSLTAWFWCLGQPLLLSSLNTLTRTYE